MRIDVEKKVVWCGEELLDWRKSFGELAGNNSIMMYHIGRVGVATLELTDKNDVVCEREHWIGKDFNGKVDLMNAVINDYTFKLEKPIKYYWRKKKEHLVWFEFDEELIYLNFATDTNRMLLSSKRSEWIWENKFTEQEARELLKDDFDKFEKVECE